MDNVTNNSDIQPYILLIEHDPELRKIMKLSLEQLGMFVVSTGQFANALQVLQKQTPDLFLVDFDLGDGDPGKLITTFRQNAKHEGGAVLVATARRLEDGWRRKYKPDSVIYKPFDIRYLIRLISLLTSEEPASVEALVS